MASFVVVGYQNGQITEYLKKDDYQGYADLIAGEIHYLIDHRDAVLLQMPRDVSIKLTRSEDVVSARVIDCTAGDPVVTTISGKMGQPNWLGSPLAWTDTGEIMISRLVQEYIGS